MTNVCTQAFLIYDKPIESQKGMIKKVRFYAMKTAAQNKQFFFQDHNNQKRSVLCNYAVHVLPRGHNAGSRLLPRDKMLQQPQILLEQRNIILTKSSRDTIHYLQSYCHIYLYHQTIQLFWKHNDIKKQQFQATCLMLRSL